MAGLSSGQLRCALKSSYFNHRASLTSAFSIFYIFPPSQSHLWSLYPVKTWADILQYFVSSWWRKWRAIYKHSWQVARFICVYHLAPRRILSRSLVIVIDQDSRQYSWPDKAFPTVLAIQDLVNSRNRWKMRIINQHMHNIEKNFMPIIFYSWLPKFAVGKG
jgi:hypothetical protein